MSDQPAKLALANNVAIGLYLFLAVLVGLLLPLRAQANNLNISITDLRQNGWEVVEKKTYDDWQDGLAPYEDIRRLVYTVVYTLKKAEKTMACTLTRDVMYDTGEHRCIEVK